MPISKIKSSAIDPSAITGSAISDGSIAAVDIGTLNDDLVFSGAVGSNATIGKNQSSGRDELQIYSGGDAYLTNSRGAGIHLYGNSDSEHHGNFAVLTGPNDNGNARIIASGRQASKTTVTIGNSIWDYVDNANDHALLNLKGPDGQPALLIEGASDTEGDIVTIDGEAMQFGHWNKSTSTFTERMSMKSNGNIAITGGIEFGATAQLTGGSTVLDDYEEGIYSPTLTGSTSGSATLRSGYDSLAYTKVGRLVTVTGRYETTGGHNMSGQVQLSLPFPTATANMLADQAETGVGYGSIYRSGTDWGGRNVAFQLVAFADTQRVVFYYNNSGTGNEAVVTGSQLDSAFEGYVNITYIANT